ncbi:Pycsar system effector family protein [Burkholderia gladioli]|uniref:Pycsar system effector family protein n=1 Tax=Burkholderia gladioli TaxID=28095 RepID=UPI00164010CE|nr:Pycsar system effector family protein [Burkholderia gladioli]
MDKSQAQLGSTEANISPPPGIASTSILTTPQVGAVPAAADAKTQPATETANPITYKFAAESHDYMREYIRNADQKAIFYFTICSALLAFEHTQSWSLRWAKYPTTWGIVDLATFISMAGLALAAAAFLLTVIPRLNGSPRGLIFFRSVANYGSSNDYISDIVTRSESDLASEKLRHCYELSKIASSKYTWIGYGLRIGAVALVCSLFLLVTVSPSSSEGKHATTGTAQH